MCAQLLVSNYSDFLHLAEAGLTVPMAPLPVGTLRSTQTVCRQPVNTQLSDSREASKVTRAHASRNFGRELVDVWVLEHWVREKEN